MMTIGSYNYLKVKLLLIIELYMNVSEGISKEIFNLNSLKITRKKYKNLFSQRKWMNVESQFLKSSSKNHILI